VALTSAPAVRAAQGPAAAAAASAIPAISRQDFRAALAPYGDWIQLPGAGFVWRPAAVEADWRPYFHGSWTWTEDGWFWVTDEPWGWATYHYGRWLYHGEYAWVWVPGTTWATAWVTWRRSDEVVGWAPLTANGAAYAAFWTFVPAARFVGERVDAAAFPPARVPALLLKTRPPPQHSAVAAPAPRQRRG
jgi:hypothetical protein